GGREDEGRGAFAQQNFRRVFMQVHSHKERERGREKSYIRVSFAKMLFGNIITQKLRAGRNFEIFLPGCRRAVLDLPGGVFNKGKDLSMSWQPQTFEAHGYKFSLTSGGLMRIINPEGKSVIHDFAKTVAELRLRHRAEFPEYYEDDED